jgi:transposase
VTIRGRTPLASYVFELSEGVESTEANGVRNLSVWRQLLGLVNVVVEGVDFDEDADALVVSVRPRKGAAKPRCGVCGRRCVRYDRGEGRRRWRSLDVGLLRCFLEAEAPRVRCGDHGVVVTRLPWARHGVGHTRDFDDQVAWLATHTSKTAVTELMRVAWRTVGAIVTRVVGEGRAAHDPFANLRRIGIDEISYKRGQRFLSVVVDHDSRRLVWVAPGRDRATLNSFFDLLGSTRCSEISLVSADAAQLIGEVVADRCPNAMLCLDPFHVVRWATDALDVVRRATWNGMRRSRGGRTLGRQLIRSRFVLWKAGERLDEKGRRRLEWIAQVNGELYRAYLLKEQLRLVFQLRGPEALAELDVWIEEAEQSGIAAFADLARLILRHRAGIAATLTHGLSNGLVESVNTKLRLLARMAFGFKNAEALVALALLDRGGYRPNLPGRAAA